MGRKPKARGATGKAPDPPAKMTDSAQSARFMETAREAGVDETGSAIEEAFRRLVGGAPSKHGAPRRRGER